MLPAEADEKAAVSGDGGARLVDTASHVTVPTEEEKVKTIANAVHRTNIINMLETHLPEERRAIAERRAALEAELDALSQYDEALERIENALHVDKQPNVLPLARRAANDTK